MPEAKTEEQKKTTCFHCGDECFENPIIIEDKTFCCVGCKSVFQILDKSNLCEYYNLSENPGVKISNKTPVKFAYLDQKEIADKFILFREEKQCVVKFHIPIIHCTSCVFLLEHLNKIDTDILSSQVNFLKKEVTVNYATEKIKLSQIAGILTDIGYEPWISIESLDESNKTNSKNQSKSRIYKIGVAGFCFANIMLLSFPEYFGIEHRENASLIRVFSYLNLILSIPVFFYSAAGFFVSAYKSLKQRFLNIDAPIALAILVTFVRSIYEITSGIGAGYLDSMSGIVFFMLLGRFFQDKTHEAISFNKNYRSYFPLGITKIDEEGKENQIAVSEIKVGDRIRIRDSEIIPGDAILFRGHANIDYSFVTGESEPVEKCIGEIIYAGGRQCGEMLELEIIKEISGSYLAELWKNSAFKKEKDSEENSFIHAVSKYFALAIFVIAIGAFTFWQFFNSEKSWLALTAVLIIACPCTLLLSSTFTFGNMQNLLARIKFVVRNARVIERIAETGTIVFDKTGTLTQPGSFSISFQGVSLNENEKKMVSGLSRQSLHPHSRAIHQYLNCNSLLSIMSFSERIGFGISAKIDQHDIKLGSARFLDLNPVEKLSAGSEVHLSIDGNYRGKFIITNNFRQNIDHLISKLSEKYSIHILSGDHERSKTTLQEKIGSVNSMLFNASPHEKLNFIEGLEKEGSKVMMLGDGLNDAGALAASNTGIAITDDMNNFTPASSAILHGSNLNKLPEIISFCKKGKNIILTSFIVSIIYNVFGIYFAVRGELQPVIAAILMPASSISIIILTWALSNVLAIQMLRSKNLKR